VTKALEKEGGGGLFPSFFHRLEALIIFAQRR